MVSLGGEIIVAIHHNGSFRDALLSSENFETRRGREHLTLLNSQRGIGMGRKIAYWATTGILCALSLFAAYSYLSGGPQAVEGFAHVGYPQQLRVLLGIAKLLGVIALLVPGWPRLKEWAYAGFTFAWIAASVAHYLANQKSEAFMPVILLVLLAVSYVTRPPDRQSVPNNARP